MGSSIEGKVLELQFWAPLIKRYCLNVFFLTIPSKEETGRRRGCVILTTFGISIDRLCKIEGLRKFSED